MIGLWDYACSFRMLKKRDGRRWKTEGERANLSFGIRAVAFIF